MFKHLGETRTLSHNLKIASLLSFVAGIVNVTGFLAVQRLTTNVTGHFAFLVEGVLHKDWLQAGFFLLYIICFFCGSFVSSFMVEVISRKNERYIYIIPVILEIIILSAIPVLGNLLVQHYPNLITCSMLFAMGLQNSLVTSISNAMVRTTHLTGLFTDLGIELSQLFFYRTVEQRTKLRSSIRLRFTIIAFFFIGGMIGGLLFFSIQIKVLWIAAFALLSGLIYDSEKFRKFIMR